MNKKFTCALLMVTSFFLLSGRVAAQLYKVEMTEKVTRSSLIVEGRVSAQQSFWNPAHTMIYTANTIELYKSFKGQPAGSTVEVLTQGGNVGNDFIETSDLAQLTKGETGVFFLFPNTGNLHSSATGALLYDIYSSDQGVLRYSIVQNKAYCPFEEYDGISTTFYSRLQALTGRQYTVINNQYDVDAQIAGSHVQRVTGGTIVSTSPSLVNAGALLDPASNILTITGNGFGAAPSGDTSLLFQNGSAALTYPSIKIPYNSPYIVSWANTEIKVRVPSAAATGRFAVYFSPGDTTYAPQILNVGYSALNATFGAPYGLQEPRLTNINGSGGYSIVYSTNTAGGGVDITTSPIFNTFKRALTTWKEIAGVNFIEAIPNTTTTQTINANDGVNIIELDNTNTGLAPLASGILATCYSGFSICTSPSNAVAQKKGFDILIRNSGVSTGSTTFENGPCAPAFVNPGAIDMETVLLHELGHALNLGHINEASQISGSPYNYANYRNPSSLMHYAVNLFDARRSPDASAYNGSQYTITPRNITLGSCGLGSGEMIQLTTFVPANDNCPLVFPTTVTLRGSAYNIDLVHATSSKSVDPQFTAVNCSGEPQSVTNNVYQAIRTNAVGGSLLLTVTNYATTPEEVATNCTASTVGTGVRVSLYAVNSCPTGQTFPAPTACATITGNGALSSINNLQPNTNYLMLFEGVRNTKATFVVTLGGTALPLKILSFTGRNVNSTTHELSVSIAEAVNVKTVEIERSADGNRFEVIGKLNANGNSYNGTHSFTDAAALKGTSYYRVKTTDMDGKVDYSTVVKLTTMDKASIAVQPNPFAGFLNIKSGGSSKLTVVVADVAMRKILQATIKGSGQVATASLAKGTYLVSVYDETGKLLTVEKLLKD